MDIRNIKSHRLYKNTFGGKIMIRLSLMKTDGESDLNSLYGSLENIYFSSAERFIESRVNNSTYFLDVKCEVTERGEKVKIKRSSTLKCGASTLKEETVFDDFNGKFEIIKKR